MSDPTGLAAGLGIESVEWFTEGGDHLTVRVSGRWRRRRPTWTGSPLLVIEAHGRRQPFPAIAEPPSLAGAAPGTWRMNFSVPASLAPHLRGSLWLKLGVVLLPLPAAVQAEALVESGGGPAVAEPGASEVEVADGGEAPPIDEGQESAPPPEEPAPPAEEAAPAEEAPAEAAPAPAEEVASAADELAAMRARVRELEEEAVHLRRRIEEAEHAAGAARAARTRAERELEAMRAQQEIAVRVPVGPALSTAVNAELDVIGREPAAPHLRPPLTPIASPTDREMLAREQDMLVTSASDRSGAYARVAALEAELQAQAERVGRAYEAIASVRSVLEAVRAERESGILAASAPGPVDPDRLAAALMRLKADAEGEVSEAPDASEAPEAPEASDALEAPEASVAGGAAAGPAADAATAAQPAAHPWLGHVFRMLCEQDPAAAALLALRLLPALRLLRPPPTAFDLVLIDDGCLQVTVSSDKVEVQQAQSPRALSEVRFRITGELEGLARLLSAGRIRRRIGRSVSSVEGDRRELAVLLGLLRAPLSLAQLHAAGVSLDPSLALTLVALMVRPEWTRGERFTLAHQEPGAPRPAVYLTVRGGECPAVSHELPLGQVSTTILCRAEQLLALFADAGSDEVEVRGEPRPLTLLRDWVKRAQSG